MRIDRGRLAGLFGTTHVSSLHDAPAALSDALGSQTPVVSPDSIELLQEVLRQSHREGWRILPTGSMEHCMHAGLPESVDLVLSLRRLAKIVDYEPGDLTIGVQAGVTLHELEQHTRGAAQRLAADPWPGAAATVGGAVAANRYGPARLGAGTLREALLGCRVVHADGQTTRSGGRVVKNVTGFDLPKLYVGSLGTLAVLVELNLRLLPRPQSSAVVHVSVPAGVAHEKLLETYRQGSGAVALLAAVGLDLPDLSSEGDSLHLLARFEGREAVVRKQAGACAAAWQGSVLEPERAASSWEVVRRHEEPQSGTQVLRLSCLPMDVVPVLERVRAQGATKRSALGMFGVGICSVRLPGMAVPEAVTLQRDLLAMGWSVQWRHAEGLGRSLLQDRPPGALDLNRKTKFLFDGRNGLPSPPWLREEASQ